MTDKPQRVRRLVPRTITDFQQTKPFQMDLFQLAPRGPHSNLVDLYDAAPRYFYARPERVEGRYLKLLKRTFDHNKQTYRLTIAPARIEDPDGIERDYYPGEREELIEDALRKFATARHGVYLANDKTPESASVVFSLQELRRELARQGHGYNLTELRHGIDVCAGVSLTFDSERDDLLRNHKSSLFAEVGFVSRKAYLDDPDTKCFVRFHPLVTRSINDRSFRRFNYELSMKYRRALARWLHKRLSLAFLQAECSHQPYRINLTTLLRWSGSKEYASLSHNIRDVKAALDEMRDLGTLAGYQVEQRKKGRKIIDALFTLEVSRAFSDEMVENNRTALGIRHGIGPIEPEHSQ